MEVSLGLFRRISVVVKLALLPLRLVGILKVVGFSLFLGLVEFT